MTFSTSMRLPLMAALLALSAAPVALAADMATNTSMTTAETKAPVMVGGAEMFATKNIVENAANSKDHTTLVAAVKAAGLADTLSGKGPFTVFAPTNAAFEKLPAGTVDTLLKPENKAKLTGILTYHVVPGTYTSADLEAKLKKHKEIELKTVNGEKLEVQKDKQGRLYVEDAKEGKSYISQADVMQSNGVIHVVDSVLMPKK